MSEDHIEKAVMPDIVRHLLNTVPVSPLSLRIIDYNQPEWLAEFNRRGEQIAELEAERDRLREALSLIGTKADFYADDSECATDATSFRIIADDAKEALEGAGE